MKFWQSWKEDYNFRTEQWLTAPTLTDRTNAGLGFFFGWTPFYWIYLIMVIILFNPLINPNPSSGQIGLGLGALALIISSR